MPYVMVDSSNDVLIGKQAASHSASQPAEAKKDHHRPPCVADVFHKPSSQLGHSCPNRKPWEKMRRREDWGRRKEAVEGSGEGGGLGKGQTG